MPIRTGRDEAMSDDLEEAVEFPLCHCRCHRVAASGVEHQPFPSPGVDPVVTEFGAQTCATRRRLSSRPLPSRSCSAGADTRGKTPPRHPQRRRWLDGLLDPGDPASEHRASTRYGLASPPATRFSIRAAFGDRDSTRTAADLSSSPHEAIVGAAAKPITRRNELTFGQKIDMPPASWRSVHRSNVESAPTVRDHRGVEIGSPSRASE